MKKVIVLYILFISMQIYSQNINDFYLKDDFLSQKLRTSDELYINGDDDTYFMNKSPLSYFDGYKEIYKGYHFPDEAPYITAELGTMGYIDKPFRCVWLIENKQLYLVRIDFYFDGIDDEKKGIYNKYSIMEQATGGKFETRYNNISVDSKKNHELMPATWFSDTLFVKKNRSSENLETWQKKAYLQMVFEDGILINMKGIVNKTEITKKIDRETIDRKIKQRKSNKNSSLNH